MRLRLARSSITARNWHPRQREKAREEVDLCGSDGGDLRPRSRGLWRPTRGWRRSCAGRHPGNGRSEERRVGKECRSRGAPEQEKEKEVTGAQARKEEQTTTRK